MDDNWEDGFVDGDKDERNDGWGDFIIEGVDEILDGLNDGSVEGYNDEMLLGNDDGVGEICELGALVIFVVAIFSLSCTRCVYCTGMSLEKLLYQEDSLICAIVCLMKGWIKMIALFYD